MHIVLDNPKSTHSPWYIKFTIGKLIGKFSRQCCESYPEILDGDAPHQQRGCDAQAWGVSEALRVWHLLDKLT